MWLLNPFPLVFLLPATTGKLILILTFLSMSVRYLSSFFAVASATKLFASHYSTSSVYTLSLDHSATGEYSLSITSTIEACGLYPSWLTFDPSDRTLYCSDEYGWLGPPATNGSLTALAADEEGVLTVIAKTGAAPGGGVHNTIYEDADGAKYLAVAHYSTSALSTYSLPLEENAQPRDVFNFELTAPGTILDRQDAPHPHMALLDPTGDFILVPDLGADLIRIFAIDKASGHLTACPSLNYTLGGGPRHAAFSTARGSHPRTVLYVVGELNGLVEAFTVLYTGRCLAFRKFQSIKPYPTALPDGAFPAEIRLTDDDMYVSVRTDGSFNGNDSIARLLQSRNGTVAFEEITTAQGVSPRTLAINKAGNLVAIGNQVSSNVVIVRRDPETGELGDVVADLLVGTPGAPGALEGLSSIIWDE